MDTDLEREKAAYLRLHTQLQQTYAAHFVAIYGERLVDTDLVRDDLMERIERNHPDQFVWVSQIKSNAAHKANVPLTPTG